MQRLGAGVFEAEPGGMKVDSLAWRSVLSFLRRVVDEIGQAVVHFGVFRPGLLREAFGQACLELLCRHAGDPRDVAAAGALIGAACRRIPVAVGDRGLFVPADETAQTPGRAAATSLASPKGNI